MKFFKLNLLQFVALISLVIFSSSCKNDVPEGSGEWQMKVTDAPIDDTEVEGVFVTVAAVKVDGKEIADFEGKQTINLLAYQNGQTKTIGTTNLEANSYSEITLVLDYESDVDGNAPGCYVKTADGAKHDLSTSTQSTGEITIRGAFEIAEQARTKTVVDFDLRKAVKYDQSSGSEKNWSFVSDTELDVALRFTDEDAAGSIEGSYSGNVESEKVIVFAYKKGEFNKSTETSGSSSSNLQFQNAVTSAVVINNNYTLSFLEEGEYELCFASYEDDDQDGEFEFEGFLQSSLMLGGVVTTDVTVEASLKATINLDIVGLIL